MVERVRFGKLSESEYGIRVSRTGQEAMTDPHPNLYTGFDSQQVIEAGLVLASDINDTLGSTLFVPFITTYSFTPIVKFWPINMGEGLSAPIIRQVNGSKWGNIPRTNNLAHDFVLLVTPSGFTINNGKRFLTFTYNGSGQLTGSDVASASPGWGMEYHVTKTRSPIA